MPRTARSSSASAAAVAPSQSPTSASGVPGGWMAARASTAAAMSDVDCSNGRAPPGLSPQPLQSKRRTAMPLPARPRARRTKTRCEPTRVCGWPATTTQAASCGPTGRWRMPTIGPCDPRSISTSSWAATTVIAGRRERLRWLRTPLTASTARASSRTARPPPAGRCSRNRRHPIGGQAPPVPRAGRRPGDRR